jgi:hypothetical protein
MFLQRIREIILNKGKKKTAWISKSGDQAVAMVRCPVPNCGERFKNVDGLAKHISYIAQSSEIGMGRDRAKKHKKWLEYKGITSDYKSVRSYLEQIRE